MKIQILNEELDIRFCMAVEIAYEEISSEAFSIDALSKSKNILALCMAAIFVANRDTAITIERLMNEASGYEIAALNKAVIDSMTEWLAIPKVIADEETNEPEPEKTEASKN